MLKIVFALKLLKIRIFISKRPEKSVQKYLLKNLTYRVKNRVGQ